MYYRRCQRIVFSVVCDVVGRQSHNSGVASASPRAHTPHITSTMIAASPISFTANNRKTPCGIQASKKFDQPQIYHPIKFKIDDYLHVHQPKFVILGISFIDEGEIKPN